MSAEIKRDFRPFFVEIMGLMWKCELSKEWVVSCWLLVVGRERAGLNCYVVQRSVFGGVDSLAKENFDMASSAFLTLAGQKQGAITGGVTIKGREGSILVHSFENEILSPLDPTTVCLRVRGSTSRL